MGHCRPPPRAALARPCKIFIAAPAPSGPRPMWAQRPFGPETAHVLISASAEECPGRAPRGRSGATPMRPSAYLAAALVFAVPSSAFIRPSPKRYTGGDEAQRLGFERPGLARPLPLFPGQGLRVRRRDVRRG